MFNNLASYLLGTASSQQDDARQQQRDAQVEHQANLRLTTATCTLVDDDDDDDEWVLVDRNDSEGNSELSSEESECEPNVTSPDKFETLLSRTSSSSSLPCPGAAAMEESWFLTPPPCFISAGPVHMETSPLENLLIEHPSMSVYQHQQQPPAMAATTTTTVLALRRPASTLAAVVDVEDGGDDGGDEDDYVEVAAAVVALPAAPRALAAAANHNRALVRADVFVQQAKQSAKQAQKVQIQKACQSLKRGYLERNNKAREVNCRNQRLRRGERSQGATRSHANNNRKC